MNNKKKWQKSFFEAKFKKVDPWNFASSESEQKKYLRQIQLVKDRRANIKKILEIGCAEGVQTKILADSFPNSEITAIDISGRAIIRAKRRLNDNDRVNLVSVDFVEYAKELKSEYFELIVWSESICYLGDRLTTYQLFSFLGDVIKKLSPQGLICMANAIDVRNEKESHITNKTLMDCYFLMLSNLVKVISKASYYGYEEDKNQDFEYQIWLFQKY